ncbi:MAG: hypothetical protein Q8N98_03025, partial [bacterium]|nr:hypothetical protein [bacterium]
MSNSVPSSSLYPSARKPRVVKVRLDGCLGLSARGFGPLIKRLRRPSESPYELYLSLVKIHGPAENFWPLWCREKKSSEDKEKIAIGAILTQRTTWHNAELALTNLAKEGVLSLRKIRSLGEDDMGKLIRLIRPAGFYTVKPARLYGFCSFIVKNYENLENFAKLSLPTGRNLLLSLPGIGPETADTILLYACGKPVFVVDEYTRRFLEKKGLEYDKSYEELRTMFEKALPRSAR